MSLHRIHKRVPLISRTNLSCTDPPSTAFAKPHLTANQFCNQITMTNPCANISHVMATVVPIQDSIMANINRSDLTAMHDAGIPTPISAAAQRRNLQKSQCDEILLPPQNNFARCPNTSFDPVRMNECEGFWDDHPPRPDGLLPPLRQADGYWHPLTLCDPHDRAYHVCEECKSDYRIQGRQAERSRIANSIAVLCKTHSLAYFPNPAIRKDCVCYETLDAGWKCEDVGVRRRLLCFAGLRLGKMICFSLMSVELMVRGCI